MRTFCNGGIQRPSAEGIEATEANAMIPLLEHENKRLTHSAYTACCMK